MSVEAFRMQNFMGFEDSGWVEFRPITLFFGRNSSGKSAILRALLLLRQSLPTGHDISSESENGPLIFVSDDGFDFGSYRHLVRNHETKQSISFWFQCDLSQYYLNPLYQDDEDELLLPYGTESQRFRIRLTYGLLTEKQELMLHSVDIYNDVGNLFLQATSSKGGDSAEQLWTFASEFFDPNSKESIWPHTVLFTRKGFFPRLNVFQGNEEEEISEEEAEDFGEDFHQIWRLFKNISRSISSFLQTLEYLGPMRAEPQRFYYVPGQSGGKLARKGQHIVRNLLKVQADPNQTSPILSLNEWLAESELQVHLELKPLDQNQTLYELLLTETEVETQTPFQANIREVGFGISQVLPVVVQTLLAPAHSTLLLEQPELHLHPGLQGQLADLLIQVAGRNNRRLLIETHSEHLLLRFQRRIAETSYDAIQEVKKALPRNNGYSLKNTDFGLVFVSRADACSTVEFINVDYRGQLVKPSIAFQEFFNNDYIDAMQITRMTGEIIQLEKKNDRSS